MRVIHSIKKEKTKKRSGYGICSDPTERGSESLKDRRITTNLLPTERCYPRDQAQAAIRFGGIHRETSSGMKYA